MKIIGYSERGAVNALFYGIALDSNEKQAKEAISEFLKLCGISGDYHDFEFFMEFSLSEFGSPDVVFTALDENDNKTVFFVEAKVSALKKFKLNIEKEHHKDYLTKLENSTYKKGSSSNLFFQLKEKYLLMKYGPNNDKKETIIDKIRKLGNNEIVNKFYKEVLNVDSKNCKYIAIIPEQDNSSIIDKDNSKIIIEKDTIKTIKIIVDNVGTFETNVVYWEDIKNNECLNHYVSSTIDFNKDKNSQILNY